MPIATVEVPKIIAASVILAACPILRWTLRATRLAIGRARKASAKTVNESRVPVIGSWLGKKSCGNTSAEAIA